LDFELNQEQEAVIDAVGQLLAQHAGPARAIALQPKSEYDSTLDAALEAAGFSDVALGEPRMTLEAALIVEAVAQAAGVCAIGARAIVAPALLDEVVCGPLALVVASRPGPVRYLAHARSLLVLTHDEARLIDVEPGECAAVASNFGYPMGAAPHDLAARGRGLGPGSAERMTAAWRIALAAEAVGSMQAALAVTTDYLKQRKQFGRTIGSFQAVQHRLAECAIQIEASRWLTREAADKGAPTEAAATAAAFTLTAAGDVFAEMHQLSGAIGFTREHDLHVHSMRLQALRLELGGVGAHRSAIVRSRWGGSAR
jgi:alkylation response protein AidB-like acyl-CoA dehydrogenase